MNKYFSPLVLAFALAASTISSGFVARNANAQSSPRPYVVLVNGYQDCCVWDPRNRGVYMETVVRELQQRGAEFRLVPWDTFRDGAGQRSSTSNDAAFLQEAADFINNRLDPNRPLILIGHSFGGDSLLSLAPRINRRIQFLGVIDPTAAGGLREPVTRRGVPANVDYFFNRWEMNALASSNVVPFDSRLVNGTTSGCRARNCDQQEQSLARRENGSEIRISCESWEVTCEGYNPIPVFLGGSNGTKAKRLAHNDMPSDAYLQRQMADRINSVLASSPPPIVVSSYSRFRLQTGTALHETGSNFAFGVLPNGDLVAIKKSGTGSGKTEVHILSASSNYQSFRLQTGTALHETGDNFAFGVLPNGDLVAIKKSGTGSGKTEVHILSASSNYQSFRLQTGTALHETGDNFAFGVLPNGDLVAIKKSGTGSGKTEVHILAAQ
jgi:hypothetical protein